MIIIHFAVLLIFLILFFMSSKQKVKREEGDSKILLPFMRAARLILRHFPVRSMEEVRKKQSLLNPSSTGYKETGLFYTKKLSQVLLVVFLGNLLGLILTLKGETSAGSLSGYRIKRNTYGEGEYEVALRTRIDGEELPEDLNVTVGERQYTREEISRIFTEIEAKLSEEIPGENESLDHVDMDLSLPSEVEPYPVTIAWAVDDYEILNGTGNIQPEFNNRKGAVVKLTATLTYFDNKAEYEFFARVYPKRKDREEEISHAVMEKIRSYDAKTVSGEDLILPQEIGGAALEYSEDPSLIGLYILLMAVLSGIVIYYGRDRDLTKQVKLREREMMLDYPEIVSRLTLLFGAGMTIRGAFEKIAGDYEKLRNKGKAVKSYAYEEMLLTVREMQSGVSELQAYQNFGNRSGIRYYNKLGTLLSQNLKKGSAGLLAILEGEAKEAFEERKAMARRLGEEAGTKLLLPMGLMLLIVMVIVIVPAFLSFSL